MGAWIEIPSHSSNRAFTVSLLAWERGLKFLGFFRCDKLVTVAPCVGAWIEINFDHKYSFILTVAPCVGAWIEIALITQEGNIRIVAPCVGAWIEIQLFVAAQCFGIVAPCVGAWIEIP